MAKIVITLTDHESGNVHIDSNPPPQQLAAKRRDKVETPAEGYALLALGECMKTSIKEAQAKMKQKMREGKVLLPNSPRFTIPN